MKFEEVMPYLREGKSLYNSEFHSFLTISKEDNKVIPGRINLYLTNDCGGTFEFFAELLLSEKWNVVE